MIDSPTLKAPMATMTANVAIVETRALRVGESIMAKHKICDQRTDYAGDNKLILIGRVVIGSRVGIRTVRVVLCGLLHRHVLLGGRRRRAGEAVTAAAEQNGAGKESGGEERAEGGGGRTFHGTTGLLA